jgi:hypothetical protein
LRNPRDFLFLPSRSLSFDLFPADSAENAEKTTYLNNIQTWKICAMCVIHGFSVLIRSEPVFTCFPQIARITQKNQHTPQYPNMKKICAICVIRGIFCSYRSRSLSFQLFPADYADNADYTYQRFSICNPSHRFFLILRPSAGNSDNANNDLGIWILLPVFLFYLRNLRNPRDFLFLPEVKPQFSIVSRR